MLRSISRSLFGQCRVVYGVSPLLFGKWPSSTAIHDCCPENPDVVLLSRGLCDKGQMLRSIRDYCSANGRCSTQFIIAVRKIRLLCCFHGDYATTARCCPAFANCGSANGRCSTAIRNCVRQIPNAALLSQLLFDKSRTLYSISQCH